MKSAPSPPAGAGPSSSDAFDELDLRSEEEKARDRLEVTTAILGNLRGALIANRGRVIDLFRKWDINGDGRVRAAPTSPFLFPTAFFSR